MTGRQVKADEALAIGLVDEVVAAEELLGRMSGPRRPSWPGAPSWPRRWPSGPSTSGLDRSLAEGLALEQELFLASFATDDAATGINSFLDKGPGHADVHGPLIPRSSDRRRTAGAGHGRSVTLAGMAVHRRGVVALLAVLAATATASPPCGPRSPASASPGGGTAAPVANGEPTVAELAPQAEGTPRTTGIPLYRPARDVGRTVLPNDPATTAKRVNYRSTNSFSITAGDLNGDNRPDLVLGLHSRVRAFLRPADRLRAHVRPERWGQSRLRHR